MATAPPDKIRATKTIIVIIITAWIDYKKAFDSVPHSWILACLKMYKINPVLTTFIEASMRQWKTNMVLVHESGVLETGPISIKRGIFQGDSLSPLLFTMSLNPLMLYSWTWS